MLPKQAKSAMGTASRSRSQINSEIRKYRAMRTCHLPED